MYTINNQDNKNVRKEGNMFKYLYVYNYSPHEKDLCEMPGAKEAIKKYVDYIIKGQDLTQEEHEKIFKDVALELCKAVNKDNFTFGNAQKVINMTAKYVNSSKRGHMLRTNGALSPF